LVGNFPALFGFPTDLESKTFTNLTREKNAELVAIFPNDTTAPWKGDGAQESSIRHKPQHRSVQIDDDMTLAKGRNLPVLTLRANEGLVFPRN